VKLISSVGRSIENVGILLTGVTGTIAKMNAVVLKMATGWLSPSTAMIKLIRAPFDWNGIDCNKIFPRYINKHFLVT
jgi:hypothetical protein